MRATPVEWRRGSGPPLKRSGRRPFIAGQPTADLTEVSTPSTDLDAVTFMVSPIRVDGVHLGVIRAVNARAKRFSQADLSFLDAAGRWLGLVIDRGTCSVADSTMGTVQTWWTERPRHVFTSCLGANATRGSVAHRWWIHRRTDRSWLGATAPVPSTVTSNASSTVSTSGVGPRWRPSPSVFVCSNQCTVGMVTADRSERSAMSMPIGSSGSCLTGHPPSPGWSSSSSWARDGPFVGCFWSLSRCP